MLCEGRGMCCVGGERDVLCVRGEGCVVYVREWLLLH